jgi:hypothetical protein
MTNVSAAITLDAALRAKLNGFKEQMEVHDEDGRTVGHFVPDGVYRQLLSSWVGSQFGDRQERAQAVQEVRSEGGLTTAEAISHLEKIASGSRGAP